MSPEIFSNYIFPAGFSLMPASYDTPNARAMLLAIGLQESRFSHRAQLVAGATDWWKSQNPPAHGWFQFERPVIGLLLKHPAARDTLLAVLGALGYPLETETIHQALRDNDLLALVFARCLLRTVPGPLPDSSDSKTGWEQYLWAWRPGKPHPETWEANWRRAWEVVLRR